MPPGFVPRAHGQAQKKQGQPWKQAGKKSERSVANPLAQDLQHLAGGVEFAIDAAPQLTQFLDGELVREDLAVLRDMVGGVRRDEFVQPRIRPGLQG